MSSNQIDLSKFQKNEEEERELKSKIKYLDPTIDCFMTKENKFEFKDKQNEFDKYRELLDTQNFNLIKLVFKFYTKYKNYGDFFLFILNNILIDDKNKHTPIKYDTDSMFGFVLEIFKDKFQEDFKDFFRENLIIPKLPNSNVPIDLKKIEKRLKDMYEQDYNDIFFKKKCHKDFLLTVFSSEQKIEEFFGRLCFVVLKNRWYDIVKLILDTCYIELDRDVHFFILTPIESKINSVFGCFSDNKDVVKDEYGESSWFSHYWNDRHPLSLIKISNDENLLGHRIVNLSLYNKWNLFGTFIYNFEMLIYVLFLLFYTLNAFQLFKNPSIPGWFSWLAVALIIIILGYETAQIIFVKIYYFFAFTHYFEWVNMILCMMAIFWPSDDNNMNVKTSLYSFSICYAYLALVFRTEKSIIFGAYSYAFRKILMKSLRVLPIVLILFFGFFFAFKIRSRYQTSDGQEHTTDEIAGIDSYLSIGLIKLSNMVMGNFDLNELGLGNIGATSNNFINYFLIDAFIFLMTIFLLNLFVGIAVGEVSDMVNKGAYHLVKARIDLLLRLFYIFSFFKIKFIQDLQTKKYCWQTPKIENGSGAVRVVFRLKHVFWILKEKMTHSKWSISYRFNINGQNELV